MEDIPDFLKRPKPDRSKPIEAKLASIVDRPKKMTEAEENEQLVRSIADKRWRTWSAVEEIRRLGLDYIPKRPRLSTIIKQVRVELKAKEKAWAEKQRSAA